MIDSKHTVCLDMSSIVEQSLHYFQISA